MKRTNINLGNYQHKAIKAMAKKTGFKMSEIIRRMIDRCLEEDKKKARA
ncbi:MAG TPA: hypothetical protein VK568_05615 [Thermodesulfobacteriota bacterium]|nr:hypothetical protein [Thermodesulfobacteriota bacterium]